MWRSDIVGGLGEHVTYVTCFGFLVYLFGATVCITVRPTLSDRCLSVCPVCNVGVYCGQTVGWINMKLGMQVGLGPSHIMLDGDPAPLSQRGTALLSLPAEFSAHNLWPNGWMDYDATWYGGRPRPRRLCVRPRCHVRIKLF